MQVGIRSMVVMRVTGAFLAYCRVTFLDMLSHTRFGDPGDRESCTLPCHGPLGTVCRHGDWSQDEGREALGGGEPCTR